MVSNAAAAAAEEVGDMCIWMRMRTAAIKCATAAAAASSFDVGFLVRALDTVPNYQENGHERRLLRNRRRR